ncbi:uncharacterized protein LOC135829132 [Sycon ciliatum]|uniref:uncharacterized protein LOC135829132 n=1 Tax=Sycon ciliatum TaxID=27933 RepID=UPI0031F716F1
MRVGGRLASGDLTYGAKHSVLLAKHHVAEMLLRHLLKSLHQGVKSVLALARQQYWIIGDRRALRSVKSKCVICRRQDARAADEVSAPLPRDRVVHQRPFGLCGVDYAGPLYVKDGGKAWIALFECGTTRAVHIDLAELGEERVSPGVPAVLSTVGRAGPHPFRQWHNVPSSGKDVVGGVAVQPTSDTVIRRVFRAARWRREAPASQSAWQRVGEGVRVARPAVRDRGCCQGPSTDTPWRFGLRAASLARDAVWEALARRGEGIEQHVTAEQLGRRQKYVTALTGHLTSRWQDEDLVTLNAYHAGRSSPIVVDDGVLIIADKQHQRWRMGRVVKLFPWRDGQVRVAEVCVMKENGECSSVPRPIRRLVPLELVASGDRDPVHVVEEQPANEPMLVADTGLTSVTVPRPEAPQSSEPAPAVPPARSTRTRTIRPPARYA